MKLCNLRTIYNCDVCKSNQMLLNYEEDCFKCDKNKDFILLQFTSRLFKTYAVIQDFTGNVYSVDIKNIYNVREVKV